MGERKVLSKYYPPDFDPSKVPRLRRPKNQETAVRFMLPMSVRCTSCGAYMGQGLKFNAKKGTTSEVYLGIKIYRFSMRCKGCPITFYIKTDPKNGDYICENGVKRNFEPWREKRAIEEAAVQERAQADTDTMVALENKTEEAKKEMEQLEELDTLKLIRSVQSNISPDVLLAMKRKNEVGEKLRADKEAEEKIRKAASQAFATAKINNNTDKAKSNDQIPSNSSSFINRNSGTTRTGGFPGVVGKEIMKKQKDGPRRVALKVSVKCKKGNNEERNKKESSGENTTTTTTTTTTSMSEVANVGGGGEGEKGKKAGAINALVDYGSSSSEWESDSE